MAVHSPVASFGNRSAPSHLGVAAGIRLSLLQQNVDPQPARKLFQLRRTAREGPDF